MKGTLTLRDQPVDRLVTGAVPTPKHTCHHPVKRILNSPVLPPCYASTETKNLNVHVCGCRCFRPIT